MTTGVFHRTLFSVFRGMRVFLMLQIFITKLTATLFSGVPPTNKERRRLESGQRVRVVPGAPQGAPAPSTCEAEGRFSDLCAVQDPSPFFRQF